MSNTENPPRTLYPCTSQGCDNQVTIGQSVCDTCHEASAPETSVEPGHYRNHPSGIQCIQVTEHMNFCLGNAVKYIWRSGMKGDRTSDLRKAIWYLEREINNE